MGTKKIKPTKELTATQQFFFDHAGYSYLPKAETRAEGKTRCAIELAAAEDFYMAQYRIGEADYCAMDDEESSREDNADRFGIVVRIGDKETSLWGIDDVSMDGYGRVVRAELASEFMP
jgi:hypothetical protein